MVSELDSSDKEKQIDDHALVEDDTGEKGKKYSKIKAKMHKQLTKDLNGVDYKLLMGVMRYHRDHVDTTSTDEDMFRNIKQQKKKAAKLAEKEKAQKE